MNFSGASYSFDTERLVLRTMTNEDATEEYAGWLNDPEVHKYLGTKSATIEELQSYIKEKDEQGDALFFGVFCKEDGKHIGTVKLEPIEWEKKRATIAVMIGDKDSWGKGYAGEAMQVLINWCFEELQFTAMDLGVIAENTAAIRVYEKLGFTETKREIGTVQYGEKIHDQVLMELQRPVT